MENKSIIKKITASREASLVIVLAVLILVVSLVNHDFFTLKNFGEILNNNVITMVMALGMLCVLLIGGIDISIASTLGLAGMTVGLMFKRNILTNAGLGFVIATLIGIVCGAIVGLIISYGGVQPIICTLGTMYVFRGLAYLIAGDEWASAAAVKNLADFAQKDVINIKTGGQPSHILSSVVFITILIYVLFYIVLKWTKFGRNIFAVGSNPEAAQISGINVKQVKFYVYLIMGALAGLTGGLTTSIYAGAQPNMQTGKEMDVIAACVIGGVSMSGGRGSVIGTLLGALILSVITKALPLVGISSLAQNTIKGVIIIVVVVLNVITQRSMDRANLAKREM